MGSQYDGLGQENRTVRYVVRSATPIFYALGCVPVFLGVVLSVALFENSLWLGELTGLYYVGDLVAVVAMFLIGGLVFGLLGVGALRLERLRRPAFLDHLRHCALLYVGLLFSGFVLFISYESQAGGLGYAYGIAVFASGVYAALVDALILSLSQRRPNHAESEGVR